MSNHHLPYDIVEEIVHHLQAKTDVLACASIDHIWLFVTRKALFQLFPLTVYNADDILPLLQSPLCSFPRTLDTLCIGTIVPNPQLLKHPSYPVPQWRGLQDVFSHFDEVKRLIINETTYFLIYLAYRRVDIPFKMWRTSCVRLLGIGFYPISKGISLIKFCILRDAPSLKSLTASIEEYLGCPDLSRLWITSIPMTDVPALTRLNINYAYSEELLEEIPLTGIEYCHISGISPKHPCPLLGSLRRNVPNMTSMRYLHLQFFEYLSSRTFYTTPLTLRRHEHLETVIFDFVTEKSDMNPTNIFFTHILESLSTLPHTTLLHSLTLRFSYPVVFTQPCGINGIFDDAILSLPWHRLDTILDNFLFLRNVRIEYCLYLEEDRQVEQVIPLGVGKKMLSCRQRGILV